MAWVAAAAGSAAASSTCRSWRCRLRPCTRHSRWCCACRSSRLGASSARPTRNYTCAGRIERHAGSVCINGSHGLSCKHSRIDVTETVGAAVAPRDALLVVEDGTALCVDLPATEACADARLLAHTLLAPPLLIGAAAGGRWLELACFSVAALAGAAGTRDVAPSPCDLAAVDAASRSIATTRRRQCYERGGQWHALRGCYDGQHRRQVAGTL